MKSIIHFYVNKESCLKKCLQLDFATMLMIQESYCEACYDKENNNTRFELTQIKSHHTINIDGLEHSTNKSFQTSR